MAKNRITFAEELVLRNGNVGIGTSNPVDNLDVRGTAKVTGSLAVTGNLQFGGISPIGDISSLYKEHAAEGKVPYSNVVSREGDSYGGIGFNTTGTTAYVLTINDDKIHQYSLSTPWYLSSGTKVGEKALNSLAFNLNDCYSIRVGPGEEKLYVYSNTTRRLVEIELLSPGDIVTAGIATYWDPEPVYYNTYNTFGYDLSHDGKKIIFGIETNNQSQDCIATIDVETAFDYGSISGITSSLWIPRIDLQPCGVEFSSDGTKAYVLGDQRNFLLEYTLSTPWEIKTGIFNGVRISLGVNPTDVKFKTDGTLLFVTSGSSVLTWTLSTPWDLSTASSSSTYSLGAQESLIRGITFKPDGGRFYIVGDRLKVHDYSLGSAWNLGTLLHEGELDVGVFLSYNQGNFLNDNSPLSLKGNIGVTTQKTVSPRGVGISSDGTKLFVSDYYGGYLTQWDLGTPWVATSGISSTYAASIPGYFHRQFNFSPDGTTLYTADELKDVIQQHYLSTPWDIKSITTTKGVVAIGRHILETFNGVFWGDNGNKVYVTSGDYNGMIFQFDLSTPYDISTLAYVKKANRTGPLRAVSLNTIRDLNFSPDGTKVVIGCVGDSSPHTFELSTPWEIDTIKHLEDDSFGDSSLRWNNFSFDISADGTKIYTLDRDTNYLIEHTLDEPWNFKNSHPSTFAAIRYSHRDNDFNSRNLAGYQRYFIKFSRDGRMVWIYHRTPQQEISFYELSNPWDISTLKYNEKKSLSEHVLPIPKNGSGFINLRGLEFDLDGHRAYLQDDYQNRIHQVNLSTPWDLTTATYNDQFVDSGNPTNNGGITLSRDGFTMYVGNPPFIYEYSLTTPWEISTATLTGRTFDASNYDVNFTTTILRSNNAELFVGGGLQLRIFRFKFDVKKVSINADIVLTGNTQIGEGLTVEGRSKFHKGEFTQISIGKGLHTRDFSTDLAVTRNSDLYSIGSNKDISKFRLSDTGIKEFVDFDRQGGNRLRGLQFNSDGTKAFSIGRTSQGNASGPGMMYEYTLSTPWEIQTATRTKLVSLLDDFPVGIDAFDFVFKPDGTKFFVTRQSGNSSDYQRSYIDQYNLSTAWDISTAKRVKTFYTGNQSTNTSLRISPDGTVLITLSIDTRIQYNEVNQYNLSTAWEIDTASHVYSVGPYIGYTGVTRYTWYFDISPDGTRVYLGGAYTGGYNSPRSPIVQDSFTMSTGWDLSTWYRDGNFNSTLWSPYENDGGVNGVDLNHRSFIFKSDGTKIYTNDNLGGIIRQYDLAEAWNPYSAKFQKNIGTANRYPKLEYSHDGKIVFFQDRINQRFFKYNLERPYELDSIISNYQRTVDEQTLFFNYERGNSLRFGDKGRKLYMFGMYDRMGSYQSMMQWDLNYAYDLDSANYESKFEMALPSRQTIADGRFNNDGTKLFLISDRDQTMYEYDVPEPWNIASIDTGNTFAAYIYGNSSNNDGFYGMNFVENGNALTFGNYNGDVIDKLYLKNPYEITDEAYEKSETLFLRNANFNTSFDLRGHKVGAGGTYLYAVNLNNDTVYQIGIDTNKFGDSTLVSTFYVGSQEANPYDVAFKSDGTRMYIVGTSNDRVQQYDLSVAWDITSATFVDNYFPNVNNAIGGNDLHFISFSSDGTKMYLSSNVAFGQFDLSTPWDATTATHIGKEYNIPMWFDRDGIPGFLFSDDGTELYVYNYRRASFKYNLSTAWDIRTAEIEGPKVKTLTFPYPYANRGEVFYASSFYFEPDGLTFYVENMEYNSAFQNITEDEVHPGLIQYNLGTPWDLTTAGFTTYLSYPNNMCGGFLINPNKKDLYVLEHDWNQGGQFIRKFTSSDEKTLDINSEVSFHSFANFDYGINVTGQSKFDRIGIGSTSFNEPSTSSLIVRGNVDVEDIGHDINLHTARVATENIKNSFAFFDHKLSNKVLGDSSRETPQKPTLYSLTFSDDGKYIYGGYYVTASHAHIIRYELETPWDVTTGITTSFKVQNISDGNDIALYYGNPGIGNSSTNIGAFYPGAIGFGSDGKYMYLGAYGPTVYGDRSIESDNRNSMRKIVQYTLDTKWDPTTAIVGLTTFIKIANYRPDYQNTFRPENTQRYIMDIKFDDSGTKMFTFDEDFQRITQYNLSTPWQVGSASTITQWPEQRFGSTYTRGFAFKNPKEIVIQSGNWGLHEVGLKTAYEITSQINHGQSYQYLDSYNYSRFVPGMLLGYRNSHQLNFNSDGTRFYVGDYWQGRIYQIDLREAWNLKTMYVRDEFDNENSPIAPIPEQRSMWQNSAQLIQPPNETCFTFTGDGTKILHFGGSYILESELRTPWVYSFEGDFTFADDRARFIKPSKTRYIRLASQDNLHSHYGGRLESVYSGQFSHDGKYLFALDSQQGLIKFKLEVPWDAHTNRYVEKLDLYKYGIATLWTYIRSFEFGNKGKVLIFNQIGSAAPFQLQLSKPYDLSTATLNDDSFPCNFECAVFDSTDNSTPQRQDNNPRGIFFKPDGKRMFIAGDGRDAIYQIELTKAWDVKTAGPGFTTSFDISSQGTDPRNIKFSTDGTEMYVAQWNNRTIDQYTLSSAWEVGTASYTGQFSTTNPSSQQPYDVDFKPDGTKMYVLGSNSYQVFQYTLSTPWDVTSATYDDLTYDFYFHTELGNAEKLRSATTGIHFTRDGKFIYVAQDSSISKFPLREAWNISSVYTGRNIETDTTGNLASYFRIYNYIGSSSSRGIYVRDDEERFYTTSNGNIKTSVGYHDRVFQFQMKPGNLKTAHQVNRAFAWHWITNNLERECDCIRFHPNGKKLYVSFGNRENLQSFKLNRPWDITSAVTDGYNVPFRNLGTIVTTQMTKIRYFEFINAGSKIAFVPNGDNIRLITADIDDSKLDFNITANTNINGSLDVSSTLYANSKVITPKVETTTLKIAEDNKNESYKSLIVNGISDIKFIGDIPDFREVSTSFNSLRDLNGGFSEKIRELNERHNAYRSDEFNMINNQSSFGFAMSDYGKYVYGIAYSYNGCYVNQFEYENREEFHPQGIIDYKVSKKSALLDKFLRVQNVGLVPQTIQVTNDGTKLYLASQNGVGVGTTGIVYQYEMTTPHDVTTLGFTTSADFSAYEPTIVYDLSFKPDGSKVYILSYTNSKINEFDLGTPWDISTAGFSTDFATNIISGGANPDGFDIGNEGRSLIVSNGLYVYAYTLTTPWDISSAVPNSSLLPNNSSKHYINLYLESLTSSQSNHVRFSDDGKKLFVRSDAYEYELVTLNLDAPWDISTYNPSKGFLSMYKLYGSFSSGSAQNISDGGPENITFTPDGKYGYILQSRTTGRGHLAQVYLEEPFEISTARLITIINLADAGCFRTGTPNPQNTYVTGIYFKPDGKRIYLLVNYQSDAGFNNSVNHVEYLDLNVPWRIDSFQDATGISSTTDYYWLTNTSLTSGSQSRQSNPYGLEFKPDGTSFYISDLDNGAYGMYQYDMEVPWEINTASPALPTLNVVDQELPGNPKGIYVSPDNTKVFMVGTGGDAVYRYDIPEKYAGRLDKATWTGITTSFTALDSEPTGIFMKTDGLKMYISGDAANAIHEFDLSVAWDVSTAVYSQSFDVSTDIADPQEVRFSPDGVYMFVLGYSNAYLCKYKLSTPWDVSTAVREDNVRFNGGNTGRISFSEPRGFDFSADGKTLVICDGRPFFDSCGYWIIKLLKPYSLTEIESFDQNLLMIPYYYPQSILQSLNSIFFDKTGDQLYILDDGQDNNYTAEIIALKMDTPYDARSAYMDGYKNFTYAGNQSPTGFKFSADGLTLMNMGAGSLIERYDLEKAWKLHTIKIDESKHYDLTYLTGSSSGSSSRISASPDLTKIYTTTYSGNHRNIIQHNLTSVKPTVVRNRLDVNSDLNVLQNANVGGLTIQSPTFDMPAAGIGTTDAPGVLFVNSKGKVKAGNINSDMFFTAPILSISTISANLSQIDTLDSQNKYWCINGAFYGGCLHPNGMIYGSHGVGGRDGMYLEINPNTGENRHVGMRDRNRWGSLSSYGAVVHPNGKIYSIGYERPQYIVFDPIQETVDVIETDSTVHGSTIYTSLCLGRNNKLYSMPYGNTTLIQEFDPVTGITTHYDGAPSGSAKYLKTILGGNGKIYGIPYSSTSLVTELDPETGTVVTFAGNAGCIGGALAPDGKIYCPPYNNSQVMVIDCENRTTSLIGPTHNIAASRWRDATLAPNGKLYALPYLYGSILEIDPLVGTSSTVGVTSVRTYGSVLAPNGKIFGLPENDSAIQVFTPPNVGINTIVGYTTSYQSTPWIHSAYTNMF